MKPSKVIIFIVCLSLVLIASGCTDSKKTPSETVPTEKTPIIEQSPPAQKTEQPAPITNNKIKELPSASENFTVHFLDVGQGDSVLIEYHNKAILIDAGESDQGEVVSDYLHDQGISTLDYVVATHPHSDHIGGMNDILNNFKVEHFVDSGYPHTTQTYENMLTTIDEKNIPFEVAQAGQTINFDSAVDIQILNPTSTYSNELNENSVVLKVTYGGVSFLLMGDAGLETEEKIMKAGYDVDADILKVGHHASRSSSGATFISAVSPEISVIEVGAGNDYGHPHAEILDRLQKASKVYRTDLVGTIAVTTDGSTYTVTTEKTGAKGENKSASSGNGAYHSIDSTTTEEPETPSSTESTVYLSDLNLKDEWVKVSNSGSSPVSLTAWNIKDEGNKHTYTFPSYILNVGSTVTLYTEKGTNSDTELYWQLDDPIWNNDGDTAYLYNNNGKLISTLEGKYGEL